MRRRNNKGSSLDAPVAEALEDAGKTVARTAIDAFVSGASEGALDLGQATPFVGPVFVILREVYALVQTASSNQDDLQELTDLCWKIAVNVFEQYAWGEQLSPPGLQDLRELVEEVQNLAKHYNGRKFWVRLLGSHKDKSEFEGLRARINSLIPVLGLSATLRSTKAFSDQMEDLRKMVVSTLRTEGIDIRQAAEIIQKDLHSLSRMASRVGISLDSFEANSEEMLTLLRDILASHSNPMKPEKLAAKPKGLPVAEHWHLEREDKVGQVIGALSVDDGGSIPAPRVIGLLGPGGAGKTTVAATVARSEEIRARFSDGVLWIPIGEGTKDQLDAFALRLAKIVYDYIAGRKGRPPPDSPFERPELGASYAREIVQGRDGALHCLLVADNVWEKEVLDFLHHTGLWLLVTTRQGCVLNQTANAVIDIRRMSEVDAERLLKLAAELEDDEPLPHAGYDLMERCDYLVMDLAFVGRWSNVRGRSDRCAWESVLDSILRQDKKIEKENASWQAGVEIERDASRETERRHAILRAGYEEMQDKRHRRLYMSLAVFPNGFEFSADEIAVLLHDRDDDGGMAAGERVKEEAKVLAESLEGWAVLGRQRDNRYSLHDTHAHFVKQSIANFPDVRRQSVSRWCTHLSTLDMVRSCGSLSLQRLFRAVEPLRENGEGLLTRAYDAALAAQDDADPSRLEMLRAVSIFYLKQGEYEAVNDLWRLNLAWFEAELGRNHPGVSERIMEIYNAATVAGNTSEVKGLLACDVGVFDTDKEMDPLQLAKALNRNAFFSLYRGNVRYAERLYRRALQLREDNLGPDHPLVGRTLNYLARCAMKLKLTANAQKLLKRALRIQKASLRRGHPHVSWTLYQLSSCKLKMGKAEEAAKLLARVLQYREATHDKDHPKIAIILSALGKCAVKLSAIAEAEELFTRALDIRVKKLGGGHCLVAILLKQLGKCALTDDTRAEEAEELFQKSHDILQASKAPHYNIEVTLKLLREAKMRQRSSRKSSPSKEVSSLPALIVLAFVPLFLMVFLWLR